MDNTNQTGLRSTTFRSCLSSYDGPTLLPDRLNTRKSQYYRGIIHNHSACSKEGCYPLSVLRHRWAAKLDFAAMTEHAERTTEEAYCAYVRECDALSDEQFRFIPGLEVATESGDMLLLGCRKFICSRDPFEVLEEAEGCVILLAHPEEGKVIDAVLKQADGMEGWNGGHMGGYMPPIDWLNNWRKILPPGKILTGGNDIHKIDPRRKILTLIPASEKFATSIDEAGILAALKKGDFLTSNGLYSLTPQGQIFSSGRKGPQRLYSQDLRNALPQGKEVTKRLLFRILARCYRFSWHCANTSLEFGAHILVKLGMDKQKRTALNRLIRQHL